MEIDVIANYGVNCVKIMYNTDYLQELSNRIRRHTLVLLHFTTKPIIF